MQGRSKAYHYEVIMNSLHGVIESHLIEGFRCFLIQHDERNVVLYKLAPSWRPLSPNR